MGLDAMANALLGTGKTLSSGAEGQELLEKWFQHGDQAAGEKVKLYCKNDVEITLGVFLYLLRHQGVYLEGAHRTIDEPTRLQHATYQREREAQDAPV